MEVGGEDGQFVEALGEAEPRRPAVREQEASPVGELEIGSRRGTGTSACSSGLLDGSVA